MDSFPLFWKPRIPKLKYQRNQWLVRADFLVHGKAHLLPSSHKVAGPRIFGAYLESFCIGVLILSIRILYSNIMSHLLVSSTWELICAYGFGRKHKHSNIRSIKKKKAMNTTLPINILSCFHSEERYKPEAAGFPKKEEDSNINED